MRPEIDKLELGSGERPLPGYLHQDITQRPGVELDFICQPWEIPLEENSLREVIALGVIEHLRFQEVHKTLGHIYNLLKKGGVFLFDVPDMKVWSEYLYNLTHNQQNKNPFRPEHIWATIYGWQRWPGDEHKSGWTRETIIGAVKKRVFLILKKESIFLHLKEYSEGGLLGLEMLTYIKAIK